MDGILQTLYRFPGYPLLLVGARVASLFHPKIREGFRLHRHETSRWADKSGRLPPGVPRIWFHATSVGEFEQAKPVVAALRRKADNRINLVLSYYSPTVRENMESYEVPDCCDILPLDTKANVNSVLTSVSPAILVFTKFDTWPNIVWEAWKRGVKLAMVDSTLRPKSFRISNAIGRSISRSLYSKFAYIGTVSEEDSQRFREVAPSQVVKTVGDTRFDQVGSRRQNAGSVRIPRALRQIGKPILVCGSTWRSDEKRLVPAIRSLCDQELDFHTVIVPHEPSGSRVQYLRGLLQKYNLDAQSYSEVSSGASPGEVTILDAVGFLAEFYRICDFCYVGGAFLYSGVHNCMEPAIMGLPLCFGPRHQNAPEAVELIRRKAARVVRNSNEIQSVVGAWLRNREQAADEGKAGRMYIEASFGSAEVYANDILALLDREYR